jgi:hypothetical protein
MREIKEIKGKTEAIKLFNKIHKTCRIDISSHALNAHRDRKFTRSEIIDLVR